MSDAILAGAGVDGMRVPDSRVVLGTVCGALCVLTRVCGRASLCMSSTCDLVRPMALVKGTSKKFPDPVTPQQKCNHQWFPRI